MRNGCVLVLSGWKYMFCYWNWDSSVWALLWWWDMTTPAQKRANERQDKKRRRQLRLSEEALEVIDTSRRDGESASRCASRLIVGTNQKTIRVIREGIV